MYLFKKQIKRIRYSKKKRRRNKEIEKWRITDSSNSKLYNREYSSKLYNRESRTDGRTDGFEITFNASKIRKKNFFCLVYYMNLFECLLQHKKKSC